MIRIVRRAFNDRSQIARVPARPGFPRGWRDGGNSGDPAATSDATAAPVCHLTISNGSTPPAREAGMGWHGNVDLWIGLPLDRRCASILR